MATGTAGNLGDRNNLFGTVPVVLDTWHGDASYPAGGYAVTGQLWGLSGGSDAVNNGIRGISVVGQNTASLATTLVYNPQTGKLQILVGGVDETPATDVSTFVYTIIVYAQGE